MDSGYHILRDFSQGHTSLSSDLQTRPQPSLTTIGIQSEVNGERTLDLSREKTQV